MNLFISWLAKVKKKKKKKKRKKEKEQIFSLHSSRQIVHKCTYVYLVVPSPHAKKTLKRALLLCTIRPQNWSQLHHKSLYLHLCQYVWPLVTILDHTDYSLFAFQLREREREKVLTVQKKMLKEIGWLDAGPSAKDSMGIRSYRCRKTGLDAQYYWDPLWPKAGDAFICVLEIFIT